MRARERVLLEEAVALAPELHWNAMPHDTMLLASLDRENGDFAASAARLREMIAGAGVSLNPAQVLFALAGLAGLAAAWGDARASVRLFGATATHPASHGGLLGNEGYGTDDLAAARAALGDAAFATAWAEGERMSLDEAIAYALALEPPPPARGQASALTPREQEVAHLIAEGRSNREIAEALVIAEPTAERHVANIFNKLGVHSRAQVAVWHAGRAGSV
jgi:DNA-binding CsgD family transcriptional regulator